MEKYGDVSGRSGVTAYEELPDGIKVQFVRGPTYLYTYSRPEDAKNCLEQLRQSLFARTVPKAFVVLCALWRRGRAGRRVLSVKLVTLLRWLSEAPRRLTTANPRPRLTVRPRRQRRLLA